MNELVGGPNQGLGLLSSPCVLESTKLPGGLCPLEPKSLACCPTLPSFMETKGKKTPIPARRLLIPLPRMIRVMIQSGSMCSQQAMGPVPPPSFLCTDVKIPSSLTFHKPVLN